MTSHIRRSVWFRWFGVVALLIGVGPALAQNNWENGKVQYNAICTNCHNSNTTLSAGGGAYPAVNTRGASASYLQGRFNAGAVGTQMGSPFTTPLRTGTNVSSPIDNTVSDIAAYIARPNFPVASLSPTVFTFNAIAVGVTATRSFRLTNSGDAPLTVTGVSLSDTTHFSVDGTACTTAAVPATAGANFCDVVVTFQPQSAASFGGRTLTISHNDLRGQSTASVSGTGLTPFTVSPTSLSFTPATAPTGVLQTTVTDNKGDRLQVCRADAATFNAPTDFALEAPSAFGPDGCFTLATTATLPRTLTLDVRFTAGAAGPRNGALRIRRVDAVGSPLAGTATTLVQLQGNPGPLATVNASRLFDAPADPGVEVDNDNVLERSFTLFSQGSDPLVFTASSFVISGPASSDYTLAGSGCQGLAGLPAFLASVAPSCVLTLRFNPADVGRRGPATLTVRIAGTPDNSVVLNGLGIRGPRLALRRATLPLASGDALPFGSQTLGGLYPPISLTLRNGGTVGNLEVALPAAGSVPGFSHAAGAGCASLAPAAECTLDLRFSPAAVQPYAGNFTIQTRAAGSSGPFDAVALALSGQGAAGAVPVLSWTDTTGTPIARLDFPDTDAGAPQSRRLRLYNDGPGGVTLQLANAIGLDASNFGVDATGCVNGGSLFEKTGCELGVQFAPGTAGLKTASIQVAANAGTSPTTLLVAPLLVASGTGIASATPPVLQLSVATMGFADAVVGAATAPLELRLSNTGSRTLAVLGFEAAAPFVVQGKTCAAVPFDLPPGNECTLSVAFQPQAEGRAAGILRITTNAEPAVQQVALSGEGTPRPDLSSGGCTLVEGDALTDPTLWVLFAAAIAVLWVRRRADARKAGRARS